MKNLVILFGLLIISFTAFAGNDDTRNENNLFSAEKRQLFEFTAFSELLGENLSVDCGPLESLTELLDKKRQLRKIGDDALNLRNYEGLSEDGRKAIDLLLQVNMSKYLKCDEFERSILMFQN